MKIYLFIILFFLIGAFFIISENNLSLIKSQNREKFIDLYSGWLYKLLGNARYVSGYVVKMNWLP